MNRVLFAVIFSFLLAFPSVAFCQFPWGALNNTIQQFNNGIALGQQQEAINNQREYLRQQAQALNQQNELARQQLELQRQAMKQSQPTNSAPSVYGYSQEEMKVLAAMNTCPQEFINDTSELISKAAKRKETETATTYSWNKNWDGIKNPHDKVMLISILAIYDKCLGGKFKRVNVTRNGEFVAYADPSSDRVQVFR